MSTLEQQHGHSAQRQIERARKYAEANGLELVDLIADIGVSAYKGQNAESGAFALFLTAVNDGAIESGSYLIVESLDRLSRQGALATVPLLQSIVDAGIIIVTLHDNQVYSRDTLETNGGTLLFAIVSMMRAHEESQIKSDRLSAVWKQKKQDAREGQVLGQKLPAWLKYDDQKMEIEVRPERVAVVQEIFELSRDGWGAYSIARKFNEEKRTAWGRSKFWQESYIKKILSNRAVLGEYQPHRKVHRNGKYDRIPDGELIKNYYPAIIPLGLFEQAKAAAKQRRSSGKGRKGKGYANLFTGLLKCDLCGGGIRYIDKGQPPKGGRYLRCSNAVVKGSCYGPAFRYEKIELTLLHAIEHLDLDYVLTGKRMQTLRASKREELAAIDAHADELASSIDNLINAIEKGAGDSGSLATRLRDREIEQQEFQDRRKVLEEELSTLQIPSPEVQRERMTALLGEISNGNDEEREHSRRALAGEINRVIARIKIRPVTRFPYEFRLDPSLWPEAAKLTDEQIEEACERFPFEFSIRYHSGEVQRIDPLTEERFRLPANSKAKIIMAEWRLRESNVGAR